MAQPLEMTMRPPPTCTTGMEIPKKSRMCVPTRNEAIKRTKLFIATWRARILRAEAGYSRVKTRKMGLPPRGFTMGNRALRISKVLLANCSKGPPEGEYSREGIAANTVLGRPARVVTGKVAGSEFTGLLVGNSPLPPCFSQVFILKGDKVLCFDQLLEVLILKVIRLH